MKKRTTHLYRIVTAFLLACMLLTSGFQTSMPPVQARLGAPSTALDSGPQTSQGPTPPVQPMPKVETAAATNSETGIAHPGAPESDPAPAGETRSTVHFVLDGPVNTNLSPQTSTRPRQRPQRLDQAENAVIEPSAAWSVVMREDFEGDFPPPGWTVQDRSADQNGLVWMADDYNPHSGLYSAWPDSSHDTSQVLNTYLIYGPFDLSNSTNAQLLFYYYNNTYKDHGYFGWSASIDGTNFYGEQVTGPSNVWVYKNFNLTSVPTLGNLAGRSQVWIAFSFRSDGVEQNYDTDTNFYDGAYLDDILLQQYLTVGTNLLPITPTDWTSPLVPASTTGTFTYSADTDFLYAMEGTYIDTAVSNDGDAITTPFRNCIYLDNVEAHCWQVNSLPANTYTSEQDWKLFEAPSEGDHVLKLVVDVDNAVQETIEDDNTWQETYTWDPATGVNLRPFQPTGWDHPIVASKTSGTHSTDVLDISKNTYVDWGVLNEGAEIASAFDICLYLDGAQVNCWNYTALGSTVSIQTNDWILPHNPLDPGSHTFRIVVDPANAVAEFNENDNVWQGTYTWVGSNCTGVSAAADLSAVDSQAAPVLQSPAPAKPYDIQLKSRRFAPQPGIDADALQLITAQGAAGGVQHMLVQLESMPTQAQVDALAAQGVHLLEYIPDRTWLAWVETGRVSGLASVAGIRWAGMLEIADKINPNLSARLSSGVSSDVLLTVYTFKDLNEAASVDLLTRAGGFLVQSVAFANRFDITLPADRVPALLALDGVQWVDFGPTAPQALNDCIRWRTGVDSLYAAPYNLNGSGVKVGMFDEGTVYAHTDFGARLTNLDSDGVIKEVSQHSTHVAGTITGSGAASSANGGYAYQWRGMAPGASLYAWDWDHNLTDLLAAIGDPGILVASNSWGYIPSSPKPGDPIDCSTLGSYSDDAPEYDQIVNENNISVIFAAGNERTKTYCGISASNPYHNVLPPSTGKNVISVGATNSNVANWTDTDSMTSFSSWGPSTDGRIKPDLVAPGCKSIDDRFVTSTAPNNLYSQLCGTSMAAPAVSGIAALLTQQFRDSFSSDPWPSTVKAVLIDTALDLDNGTTYFNPGPDYASGYGRVDAKAAADLIRAKKLLEATAYNGAEMVYSFNVASTAQPLKITLVWDDKPGTPNASPALVNDLDLWLVAPDGSTIYRPWVLDPAHPANAASTGVDSTNNVEQVFVPAAEVTAGKWLVHVKGTSVLPEGQKFSLAGAVLASDGTCFTLSRSSNPPNGGTINVETPLNCNGYGYLPGTPVTVMAEPASGYTFTGWSGDASGMALTTTVEMSDNRAVTASFSTCYQINASVSPAGSGQVSAQPPPDCNNGQGYNYGTDVTLTAAPTVTASSSHLFDHWSGDASGTNSSVTVTMTANRAITANFTACFKLTTSASPAGSGQVGVNPPPQCPGVGFYLPNTPVKLQASGTGSYAFYQWTGDLAGSNNPETVVMDRAKTVTANFIPPPGRPTLTAPADNALLTSLTPLITWKAPTPAAVQYDIQLAYDPEFKVWVDDTEFIGPVSDLSYTLGPLEGELTYYWRVRGINAAGVKGDWSSGRSFTTPIVPPGLLQPINGDTVLSRRPVFDWDDIATSVLYNLQVSGSASFSTLLLNLKVEDSTYTPLADLGSPGKKLYWRVRSYDYNLKPGPWSVNGEFVNANPPSIPTLVAPISNRLSMTYTPKLDWSNSSLPKGTTFDHYQVQLASDINFTPPLWVDEPVSGAASSYLDITSVVLPDGYDGLPDNGTYYWRVRSYNTGLQYSSWSKTGIFRTVMKTPVLTGPLDYGTPEYVNQLSLRPEFSWNPVNGASSYTLQVAKSTSFGTLSYSATTTATQFTPTKDLPANAKLYWRVRANGKNGPSGWSSPWSLVSPNPPKTSILVSPANNALVMTITPKLDWSNSVVPKGTEFDHYQVQVSTTVSFTDADLKVNESVGAVAADSFYNIVGGTLTYDTRYYWRVRAYNNAGENENEHEYSSWSAVRSFKIAMKPPELVNPGPNAIDVTARPAFQWTATVPNATSYTLQLSTSPTFSTYVLNLSVKTTSYSMTKNLVKGKIYYWRVRHNVGTAPGMWRTDQFTTSAN